MWWLVSVIAMLFVMLIVFALFCAVIVVLVVVNVCAVSFETWKPCLSNFVDFLCLTFANIFVYLLVYAICIYTCTDNLYKVV